MSRNPPLCNKAEKEGVAGENPAGGVGQRFSSRATDKPISPPKREIWYNTHVLIDCRETESRNENDAT